jgi:hypothetical protein
LLLQQVPLFKVQRYGTSLLEISQRVTEDRNWEYTVGSYKNIATRISKNDSRRPYKTTPYSILDLETTF